ncbi:unnamed protein product [Sphagnum balticum]
MSTLAIVPDASTQKVATTLKQIGTRRDYQMINPRLIDIEPGFNPRNYDLPENREHVERLAKSIGTEGLIQPLTVRLKRETGRATLVDGECRYRAIMALIEAGHPVLSEPDSEIPCFPAPQGSNDDGSRLLTAITANTGKPLSKWELGTAFQRLFNFGLSPERIASRTGYTERFISEAIELADAPQEVKELLSTASISTGLALATLRANPAEATAILKQKVEVAKANGQATAKRDKAPAPKQAKAETSALVIYAAEAMAAALDAWMEDATATAEERVIAAHKEYRKLMPAPKQEQAA